MMMNMSAPLNITQVYL